MAEPYLPPKLWRVDVQGPDSYIRPRSKIYADQGHADRHADSARRRGFAVEIYECEPTWRKIDEASR